MTDETHPDLPGLTRAASDIISVRRVFGEPYEHGSTLVVPVAKVMGWHGVAGAHADARVGIRGGHGGPGSTTPGSGEGGGPADGGSDGGTGGQGGGTGGPAGHGGDGGPGDGAGGPSDGAEDSGHGAHAGAPAPEDGPWAQSGPGAPTGAVGSAAGAPGGPTGPGGPGGPVAWAGPGGGWPHGPGRGGWHGGPGHGGRLPFLRGPLWPFGTGRPGGRGVGAADAGGYATRVKPLGVFVIDDDGAQWQPALDLNRIILGGQVVGAVATVALAWALRRRRLFH